MNQSNMFSSTNDSLWQSGYCVTQCILILFFFRYYSVEINLPEEMVSVGCMKFVTFLAIVISILSLAGIITLGAVWSKKLSPFQDYSLVVDAGSTHSKIFLYK